MLVEQALPEAQRAQGPPQSTSVSLPFFSPSWQLGAAIAQSPPSQFALAQSEATRQCRFSAHLMQSPAPPQSTSVSVPFFSPSVQVGAGLQRPSAQRPELQSVSSRHARSRSQCGHSGPPQSRSVSRPFTLPSEQVGAAAQVPFAQIPLAQSPSEPHGLPIVHAGQMGPPQSTPDSLPLCAPSSQRGGGVMQVPFWQVPLTQSRPCSHERSLLHGRQTGPPQSVSLSRPFRALSAQVASGGSHWPFTQLSLRQSDQRSQLLAVLHEVHDPPQSTSVSSPS